jgi:hypothetical protein
MTDPQRKAAHPRGGLLADLALATEILGGKEPELALATQSGCRCAAARVTNLMASGRLAAGLGQTLINSLNACAQMIRAETEDIRARAQLALEERRVAVVESSQRELQRRNDLRAQELRILEARRVGRPNRLLEGPEAPEETFAQQLERFSAEEADAVPL